MEADDNTDCVGVRGLLAPVMTLDEFVSGADAERASLGVGGDEEEEKWSEVSVSVSDTETER